MSGPVKHEFQGFKTDSKTEMASPSSAHNTGWSVFMLEWCK